jgi:hypothetical protein
MKVTVSRQSWLTDLLIATKDRNQSVVETPPPGRAGAAESVPPERPSRVSLNDRHQDLLGPSLGKPTTGSITISSEPTPPLADA